MEGLDFKKSSLQRCLYTSNDCVIDGKSKPLLSEMLFQRFSTTLTDCVGNGPSNVTMEGPSSRNPSLLLCLCISNDYDFDGESKKTSFETFCPPCQIIR
jgi:hypothetical protein